MTAVMPYPREPQHEHLVEGVELRHLRTLMAIAGEHSVQAAAERLYIAPSALNRQVRQLEERIGAALLVRGTGSVELTAVGTELLDQVSPVLERLAGGIERVRRIGRGEAGTLRIGFHTAAALELTGPLLDEFSAHHPHVDLELAEIGVPDMSAGVRTGESDVGIVRTPIELDGLEHEPLFSEPVVAGINAGHPLADSDELAFEQLIDEPIIVWVADDEHWVDFWSARALRRGRELPVGGYVTTYNEGLELVVSGAAIFFAPAAVSRYFPRPEVRCLPVTDLPRSEVAVVWRTGGGEPLVAGFLEAARVVRERERRLVRCIESGAGPPVSHPPR